MLLNNLQKASRSGDGQEGFVKKRAHPSTVIEALTAIAFAIAAAPASPILLSPNL